MNTVKTMRKIKNGSTEDIRWILCQAVVRKGSAIQRLRWAEKDATKLAKRIDTLEKKLFSAPDSEKQELRERRFVELDSYNRYANDVTIHESEIVRIQDIIEACENKLN